MRNVLLFVATMLVLLGFTLPVSAEPTRIDVRVISKGAKFVGTSMSGARVTIRDADTGELLADGVVSGSTGDTDRIMKQEAPHHAPVSSDDSGVFRATVDLDEPRRIEVTAYGPLAQIQAANRVSATQWVIPGKHITGGDGWLLELPGFVVDVLDPPAHLKLAKGPQKLHVRANVTMMCGCPVTSGGLWDADRFEVAATISRAGGTSWTTPLGYAGSPSQFAGDIQLREPGIYEILVYAHDPANGNTGLDRTTVVVAE